MYSNVFNTISRYFKVFNFATLLHQGGDSHTSTHGAFGSLAFGLSLKLCFLGAGAGWIQRQELEPPKWSMSWRLRPCKETQPTQRTQHGDFHGAMARYGPLWRLRLMKKAKNMLGPQPAELAAESAPVFFRRIQ